MDNSSIKFIIVLLSIFLVSTNVIAFGISATQYTDSSPLAMYPGQTLELQINLQNCPQLGCENTNDAEVVATIEEGSNIAELPDGNNYNVPFGTHDTFLKLRISIPENANIGDSDKVNVKFTGPPSEDAGTVQLGIVYNYKVPIIIKSQEEVEQNQPTIPKGEINLTVILTIIAVIIIIIIVVALIFYMKKRSENKTTEINNI